MINQGKIEVELNNKCFTTKDLVSNIIDKLTSEGHTCSLQA